MNNFYQYYANLSPEKKVLTLCFCPCVTIYYLIYNIFKELKKCFECVLNRCICPIANTINKALSFVCEKICKFFDLCFGTIMNIISKCCEFVWMIIQKFLGIFKPCFTFISRILTFIVEKICFVFAKIYLVFETVGLYIINCFDRCFHVIYSFTCKPIFYVINVFCSNLCRCVNNCFMGIYRIIIKPIRDYIFFPIYLCIMKNIIIRIYDFFEAIFIFIYTQINRVFQKIKAFFIEVKNMIVGIFMAMFNRNVINVSKTNKVIVSAKPKIRQFKVVDMVKEDKEDLEDGNKLHHSLNNNQTYDKNGMIQIFSFDNKDKISSKR